jgi:hypothetical protein
MVQSAQSRVLLSCFAATLSLTAGGINLSGKSFVHLNGGYAKHADRIYHWRARTNRDRGPRQNPDPRNYHPMSHADAASFEPLGDDGFGRDKNTAFWDGHGIQGSDAATFKVMGRQFARDATHLYFRDQAIAGIDAASVAVLSPDDVFFKDKNGIYFLTYRDNFSKPRPVPADQDSFLRLDGYYSQDRQHIFYEDKILEGVDLKTFEVYPPYDDDFAKDKNHVYKRGARLETPHAETFELISQAYSRDKNHVYYNSRLGRDTGVIDGADPETFTYFNGKYQKFGEHHVDAEDKNFYYISTATGLIVLDKH